MVSVWLNAFRLRTLPLALSCVLLGSFLAAAQASLRINVLILSALTATFLQILSNLANDYGDSVNGADHAERKGPTRAVQSGTISPQSMKNMIAVFVVLSLASGLSLLWVSLNVLPAKVLYVLLAVGIASIVAAMTYTMGKRPYGYVGLGDLSVFLFFGLVGVLGVYVLHTGAVAWVMLLPAATSGLFAVAVLNINNIRDIDSDKQAGKLSLPVRMGPHNAKIYHSLIVAFGWLCAIMYVWQFDQNLWSAKWLFLIAAPLFVLNVRGIWRGKTPAEIDPFLRQMALSTLLFVILLGLGLCFA
ncbi:MAG: 1,4-dihydroxy-2-naphthoate polyprenyltransferase [Cytophagales bacterium]|nr:MAG: 1,4-dihydroxy-2-naphthoate polyprenyltransferase [Cytophagales bacterium]TAF60463.1 MAG: 1,4-dihydroxy-2-naphthoate polyprenyltransferase [Cytophagales bacterium]